MPAGGLPLLALSNWRGWEEGRGTSAWILGRAIDTAKTELFCARGRAGCRAKRLCGVPLLRGCYAAWRAACLAALRLQQQRASLAWQGILLLSYPSTSSAHFTLACGQYLFLSQTWTTPRQGCGRPAKKKKRMGCLHTGCDGRGNGRKRAYKRRGTCWRVDCHLQLARKELRRARKAATLPLHARRPPEAAASYRGRRQDRLRHLRFFGPRGE